MGYDPAQFRDTWRNDFGERPGRIEINNSEPFRRTRSPRTRNGLQDSKQCT